MSTYDQQLQQVAEETFENLAFMLVMPDDEPLDADGPQVTCEVDFSGPFGGRLYLRVSQMMLSPLASNMLGLDFDSDPPSPVQQNDALGELLNVVCGNVLPAIAGTEPLFNVSAPKVLEDADLPTEWQGRQPAGAVHLELDSGSAELVLFLDGAAPLAA